MAPKLTNAEKCRRYREKRKDDDDFRMTNKARVKKFRQSVQGQQRSKMREQTKLRTRTYRQRLKTARAIIDNVEENDASNAYATRQAFGKALRRAESALSDSPRKKVEVVRQLATSFGLQVNKSPRTPGSTQRALDIETKGNVFQFYTSDGISRQMPGKSDLRTVRINGKKERLPRRIMMYNLREAHVIFNEKYPNRIAISKFCTQRPPHVQLVSKKSQECCCCPYCENLTYLLKSVHWSDNGGKAPKSLSDLITLLVCDPGNAQCMKRLCPNCRISIDITTCLDELIDDDREADILVYQWNAGKLTYQPYSLAEIYEMLEKQISTYMKHIYNCNSQMNALNSCKTDLREGEIILQTDFAENYVIRHQKEVMAAHFQTGDAVTIYTCIAYYKDGANLKHKSFAVISDTVKHTALEVHVFNCSIIEHLRTQLGLTVNHIHMWTDGAASHFKNKLSMVALTHYPELNGCTADWSFMESYHGKGPHDGIGALVKWGVYRKVLQRVVVRTPEDFFNVAKNLSEKTVCLYNNKQHLEQCKAKYSVLWDGCKSAISIQQCRHIKVVGKYRIGLYKNTHDASPLKECYLEPDHEDQSDDGSNDGDLATPLSDDSEANSEGESMSVEFESDLERDADDLEMTNSVLSETVEDEASDMNQCGSSQSVNNSTEQMSKDDKRVLLQMPSCSKNIKEVDLTLKVERKNSLKTKLSNNKCIPITEPVEKPNKLQVGDFVIAKYQKTSIFLAQVIKIEGYKGYEKEAFVHYMRYQETRDSVKFFKFPVTDDVDIIPYSNILHILPQPEKAGQFYKWKWQKEYPQSTR